MKPLHFRLAYANESEDHKQDMNGNISLTSLATNFPGDYDENEQVAVQEERSNNNFRATEEIQTKQAPLKRRVSFILPEDNCNQCDTIAEEVELDPEEEANMETSPVAAFQ